MVEVSDHNAGTTQTAGRYVYLLTLDGGDFYMGLTDNLARQVRQHHDGEFPSTAGRNPQLVWSEQWVGDEAKLQGRMDHLARLYSENPNAMLYRLQARLPLGGIQWG